MSELNTKVKTFCDKKVEKLFSDNYWNKLQEKKRKKGNLDELYNETDARTKYILHTATIDHGHLVEELYLKSIETLCKDLIVWEDKKFKISKHASNISNDQDNKNIESYNLDYGEAFIKSGKKVTNQIDVFTFNKKNKTLCSYEIKRGGGHHDRQKKDKLLADILATLILMKSYGKKVKNLDVLSAKSFVISHMNQDLVHPTWKKIQIYGRDIDKHFNAPVSEQIELGLDYFKTEYNKCLKNWFKSNY